MRWIRALVPPLLIAAQGAGEPAELDPDVARFVVANAQWTLFHELGHALLDVYDVPFLGNEENIADTVATVVMLQGQYAPDGAPPVNERLLAAAMSWRTEAALEDDAPIWDSHMPDLARFYNIVCLTYGADPEANETLPTTMGLPPERAAGCIDEYQQALDHLDRHVLRYGRRNDDGAPARGGKVRVTLAEAADRSGQALRALMQEARIARRAAEVVEAKFVLPRDIGIVFMDCLGEEAAFWREDLGEIILCYELLDRFVWLARFRGCFDDVGPVEERRAAERACIASTRRLAAGPARGARDD